MSLFSVTALVYLAMSAVAQAGSVAQFDPKANNNLVLYWVRLYPVGDPSLMLGADGLIFTCRAKGSDRSDLLRSARSRRQTSSPLDS